MRDSFSKTPPPEGPLLGCKDFESACISRRIAQPDEIDELGHVNNSVYVRWVQDAAVGHWQAVADEATKAAAIWVCSRHEIDYKDQVREGEEVELRTWLGTARGARFSRHCDIRKKGASRPAAVCETQWVLLDRATGRPRRVEAGTMELFGLDPADHSAR
ncbi:hypothetical protein GCM10007148_23840 [Parvularcula lutaonensis]|nr:hypothetical protein GCM10007148_23840 [Parvularcula lutaonensis]